MHSSDVCNITLWKNSLAKMFVYPALINSLPVPPFWLRSGYNQEEFDSKGSEV